MNDSGRNQGPRNGGRRFAQRPGAGKRGQQKNRDAAQRDQGSQDQGSAERETKGQERQAQRPIHHQVQRPVRDTSTLGLRGSPVQPRPPSLNCAYCEKPIFDLAGALADRETGNPVHFDCAMERVAAAEPVEPGEKIVYLGAGCFGVVAPKEGNSGAIVVKRRIRWEKEGEKQAWRKDQSSRITFI